MEHRFTTDKQFVLPISSVDTLLVISLRKLLRHFPQSFSVMFGSASHTYKCMHTYAQRVGCSRFLICGDIYHVNAGHHEFWWHCPITLRLVRLFVHEPNYFSLGLPRVMIPLNKKPGRVPSRSLACELATRIDSHHYVGRVYEMVTLFSHYCQMDNLLCCVIIMVKYNNSIIRVYQNLHQSIKSVWSM